MSYFDGSQAGINQANAVESQDAGINQAISQLNNARMTSYRNEIGLEKRERVAEASEQGREDAREDREQEEQKLGQLTGLAEKVPEKYKEFQSFVKEGGSIDKLASYRAVKGIGGVGSKIGEAGQNTFQNIRSGVVGGGAPRPSVGGIEVSGTDMTGDISQVVKPQQSVNQSNVPEQEEQPQHNQAGSDEAEQTNLESSNAGEEVGEEAEQVGEEAGKEASTVGKIGTRLAKVGGSLVSAGMLGDDIYNQVKSKSVFYGVNTGDKVGNFMNELGSGADLLGVATGDPLLAVAGVGLGAVGSLVSDISELFGHHDKKQEATAPAPAPPPPPKQVAQAGAINLAGTGGIIQGSSSTLSNVRAGGM